LVVGSADGLTRRGLWERLFERSSDGDRLAAATAEKHEEKR